MSSVNDAKGVFIDSVHQDVEQIKEDLTQAREHARNLRSTIGVINGWGSTLGKLDADIQLAMDMLNKHFHTWSTMLIKGSPNDVLTENEIKVVVAPGRGELDAW